MYVPYCSRHGAASSPDVAKARGPDQASTARVNGTRDDALSFGRAAREYDRWRAGYPPEAIRWALEPVSGRDTDVVDLGAGTGILSRALLARGVNVIPVEPSASMRAQLVRRSPQLRPLAGTAEDIPLSEARVEAVVVGQAYHWFNHELAHPEIARVLKPAGVLATLWNSRDASEPWVAELNALARNTRGYVAIEDDPPELRSFGPHFGPLSRRTFRHTTSQTPESLFGMVSTTSYYLTAPPSRQRELKAQIYDLSASHPTLAGRPVFHLPHRTTVYRAVRLAEAAPCRMQR